jgi:magnesium-transporting ATPase (P-type)
MFNLFVLMQILNYFNCRKQKKSLINVFHNLKVVSMMIVLSILILHYIFVQNIGDVAGLYPYGLTFTQWILCLALAMLTWVFEIIFQLIPNA